ncbi:Pyridoxine/pyridoxamine 5'-phosphate oxidase [bacterium HR15]|nr:Pyridoxine/pyridoxamine 5'-phosphate oxidase [bacterium HR15]
MNLYLRKEYSRGLLLESEVDPNPIRQLQRWLQEAIEVQVVEPHAMCLATADAQGHPDARFVLLRGLDERGLVFYTNANSPKGRQLRQNPYATAVFWWSPLERQVRVQGMVETVSKEEADAYFASRPREHQLAAWASPQSEVIPNRQVLEARMAELERQYEGRPVPRPPYWIGYRIVPHTFEFWQGRPHRLHDRLRYTRHPDGSWKIERLAP